MIVLFRYILLVFLATQTIRVFFRKQMFWLPRYLCNVKNITGLYEIGNVVASNSRGLKTNTP